MTTPANLTERHYAEQALLAAVVTERKASAALTDLDNIEKWNAWSAADRRLDLAAQRYYEAVQESERTADPAVENIAEAGTFEVHDCPGGAYVITEAPVGTLAAEFDVDALRAQYETRWPDPVEPHDPDDQYDSGYVAYSYPAEADGRAADEFYRYGEDD